MQSEVSKKHSYGITLVELMAVLVILGLVSVLAIPALNLWRSQSMLKDAATTVQSILREARGMAIARSQEFTMVIDAAERSAVINDTNGTAVSKKWLAPIAVDITDFSGRLGICKFRFKIDGGCVITAPKIGDPTNTETILSVSIHLKRHDAKDTETEKYYTIVVNDVPGTARIYSTKQN